MRRLVVVVLVLSALALLADRAAAALVATRIASEVRATQGLARTPDVTVLGFPFLTQAIGGSYDGIDLTARGLTGDDGVTLDRLDVRLRDVEASLPDLAAGAVDGVTARTAEATGTATYADLDAAVARSLRGGALEVRFSAAGGLVGVTGRYRAGPFDVALDGTVLPVLEGDLLRLEVQPESLEELPPAVRRIVADLLGITLVLPELPFGFEPQEVRVSDAGVALTAVARDVTLAGRG